jgi:hypothetical protein
LAISAPTDGRRVGTTTPTISGSSAMSSGTALISIDGGPEHAVSTALGGAWTFTPAAPLAEGPHTYVARALYYGLVGPATALRSLVVDTTPPIVAVLQNSPPAGVSPTFSFSSSERLTTYDCQIDGGATISCGSPFRAPALQPGGHTLSVRGTDAAGNTGTTVAAFTVAAIAREGSTGSTGPAGGGSETQTCPGLDGAPATAAQITLLDARVKSKRLLLRVSSDRTGLIGVRVAIGKQSLGTYFGAAVARIQTLSVKLKRKARAGNRISVSISIVARSGARASVATLLAAKKSGSASAPLGALPASGAADCRPLAGAKRPSIRVTTPKFLSARATAAKIGLAARGWTLALVRLEQPQAPGSARVVLLRPGRKLTTVAHLTRGGSLTRGPAAIKITAISPDGAGRTIARRVAVR